MSHKVPDKHMNHILTYTRIFLPYDSSLCKSNDLEKKSPNESLKVHENFGFPPSISILLRVGELEIVGGT